MLVGEPFPAQERVAEAIAKRIEPELGDGGRARRRAAPTKTWRRTTCTCRAAIT